MLHFPEALRGRGADALRRRVGDDQLGVLLLDRDELVIQAVVLRSDMIGSSSTWYAMRASFTIARSSSTRSAGDEDREPS